MVVESLVVTMKLAMLPKIECPYHDAISYGRGGARIWKFFATSARQRSGIRLRSQTTGRPMLSATNA